MMTSAYFTVALNVSGPIFIKNIPRIKKKVHSVRRLPGSLSPPVCLPAVSSSCDNEQTGCRRAQKPGEGTVVTSNPARERLER